MACNLSRIQAQWFHALCIATGFADAIDGICDHLTLTVMSMISSRSRTVSAPMTAPVSRWSHRDDAFATTGLARYSSKSGVCQCRFRRNQQFGVRHNDGQRDDFIALVQLNAAHTTAGHPSGARPFVKRMLMPSRVISHGFVLNGLCQVLHP